MLIVAAVIHAAAWGCFLYVLAAARAGREEFAAQWQTIAAVNFIAGGAVASVLFIAWALRHPPSSELIGAAILFGPQYLLAGVLLSRPKANP